MKHLYPLLPPKNQYYLLTTLPAVLTQRSLEHTQTSTNPFTTLNPYHRVTNLSVTQWDVFNFPLLPPSRDLSQLTTAYYYYYKN